MLRHLQILIDVLKRRALQAFIAKLHLTCTSYMLIGEDLSYCYTHIYYLLRRLLILVFIIYIMLKASLLIITNASHRCLWLEYAKRAPLLTIDAKQLWVSTFYATCLLLHTSLAYLISNYDSPFTC